MKKSNIYENDTNIRSILNKNILNYLTEDFSNASIQHNLESDKYGMTLITTIRQSLSYNDIKKLSKAENKNAVKDLLDEKNKFDGINKQIDEYNINEEKENIKNVKRKKKAITDVKGDDVSISKSEVQNNSKIINKKSKKMKCEDKLEINGEVKQIIGIVSCDDIIPCGAIVPSNDKDVSVLDVKNTNKPIKGFSQTRFESKEMILLEHIECVKKTYKLEEGDAEGKEFYDAFNIDTIEYLKDEYESIVSNLYKKVHNKEIDKAVSFLDILKETYGYYWFSSTGSAYTLFKRIDKSFVFAWHDYLEYLSEVNRSSDVCELIKGWNIQRCFFRIK